VYTSNLNRKFATLEALGPWLAIALLEHEDVCFMSLAQARVNLQMLTAVNLQMYVNL
jgi:hypothetical protein